MSKASEYGKQRKILEESISQFNGKSIKSSYINFQGNLCLEIDCHVVSPKEALKFGKWLVEMFS